MQFKTSLSLVPVFLCVFAQGVGCGGTESSNKANKLMEECYPIKDANSCQGTGCSWSQEGCSTSPGQRFNLCLGSDVKDCDLAAPSCSTGTTCQAVNEVACAGGSGQYACQACGVTRYLCLPPP